MEKSLKSTNKATILQIKKGGGKDGRNAKSGVMYFT